MGDGGDWLLEVEGGEGDVYKIKEQVKHDEGQRGGPLRTVGGRSGTIALWSSPFLRCIKPWVQFPILLKERGGGENKKTGRKWWWWWWQQQTPQLGSCLSKIVLTRAMEKRW